MALSEEKVEKILRNTEMKKDTYKLIKYSDEIERQAGEEFGNILNRTSIIKIINDFKQENKLRNSTSVNKFIDILIRQLKIFKPIKIFNEYKKDSVVRYVNTNMQVSPYEIALSLLSRSFLSHYSALYVNDLTLNNPKDIYINKEQSKKFMSNDAQVMSQGRIDYAFSKKMRRTNMIYSFNYEGIDYKVHVLNSKNTNNTGVVYKDIIGFSKPIRTTNIERTLIDTIVRPGYSGGSTEILDGFKKARGNIDFQRLWEYLEKFNYSYPYYKSVAFYMKYSGYDYQKYLTKFYENDIRNELTFYLDYQIISPQKDEELNIYFSPTILEE